MNNSSQRYSLQERFAEIFARLRDQDIEQFYANYQLWVMRHRVPILENEIEALRADIAENQRRIQALHFSAIALAVLARLQSNGVSDIELLDQMLERGEDWLDHMMQRLDYCEQVEDFIQGDYTQWCVNSLEGAYDWIDSVRGSAQEEWPVPQAAEASSETEVQATAELLLHKLSFDDEEAMLDVTHTPPAPLSTSQAVSENSVEESIESTENPTYEQALAILDGEAVVLADEISVETDLSTAEPELASSPQPTSTNEQPAPWYSISLEANESFDFERPGSMDDWITVLQADSSVDSEINTPEIVSTQTAEPPIATTSSEHIEPVEQVAQIVSEHVEISEEVVSLEPVSEGETSIEHTAEVPQEETASEPETRSEQDEDTLQEPGEYVVDDEASAESAPSEASTEEIILAEPEHETIGVANEQLDVPQEQGATFPKKKALHKDKKTLKLQPKAGSKFTKKITVPTKKPEVAENALAPTSKVQQPIADATIASDMSKEPGQPADLQEVVHETTSEDQQPPTNEITSIVSEDAQVLTEPAEYVEEEPILTPPMEIDASQNDIEEPEEGQLPWYDYLIVEKTVSDEQTPIVADPSDETLPIVLRDIRLAQAQQRTTNASESLAKRVGADHEKVNEIDAVQEIIVSVDSEEISMSDVTAGASVQERTVTMVEEQSESEHLATPQAVIKQVVVESIPVQEKPKKVGFWQRLLRRMRQK
ncbi:MAG: hypothetical protein ABI234_19780 [Ktedonobacteraceae bacterium]